MNKLLALAILYGHQDFSVNFDKVMEKFVSARRLKSEFWTILSSFCLTKMCCLCIQFKMIYPIRKNSE